MSNLLIAPIVKWDTARGFGFLQVGTERVFLHIKDFAIRNKNMAVGDLIRFTLGEGPDGRTRAKNAVYLGTRALMPQKAERPRSFPLSRAVLLLLLLIAPGFALHKLAFHPGVTLISAVGISIVTYLIYALDKMSAVSNAWRVSENTLHFLSLIGGWPGAFVAQQRLRHKTAKTSFQIVFWLTILAYQAVSIDYLLNWKISHALWFQCNVWLQHLQ